MILCSDALAWALLHFEWQAFVIAFVYKCAIRSREGASAVMQYNFALAALLAMAVGFSFTLVYEFFRITQFVTLTAPATTQTQQFHSHARYSSFLAGQQMHLLQWIDVVWFTGSFFFLLRSVISRWQQSRTCKYGCPLSAGELYETFKTISERMHISKLVHLRTYPFATGPFVCGVFQSAIYLPVSLITGLPPDQLELILVHEMAHVRRGDYAWNVFQKMMEGLFFFHPAIWGLGRILREQRELCCDSIVVESCPHPIRYAEALLNLAESRHRQIGFAIPAAGKHDPRFFLYRIERILGEASQRPIREPEAYRYLHIASAIPILFLALALFLASGSVPSLTPIPATRTNSQNAVALKSLSNTLTNVRGHIYATMTKSSRSTRRQSRTAVECRTPEFSSNILLVSTNNSHFHTHSHPHEHHHKHTHDNAV